MDDRREHEQLELALEAAQLGTWYWDEETGRTVWDAAARGDARHGAGHLRRHLRRLGGVAAPRRPGRVRRPGRRRDGRPGPVRAAAPLDLARRFDPLARGSRAGHHRRRRAGARHHRRRARRHRARGAPGCADAPHRARTTGSSRACSVRCSRCACPRSTGIEFAARYEAAPGSAIGGDWYTFVPLRGGRLGVAIGDVAGHGLSAVAEMAHIRFSLRSLSYLHDDPHRRARAAQRAGPRLLARHDGHCALRHPRPAFGRVRVRARRALPARDLRPRRPASWSRCAPIPRSASVSSTSAEHADALARTDPRRVHRRTPRTPHARRSRSASSDCRPRAARHPADPTRCASTSCTRCSSTSRTTTTPRSSPCASRPRCTR